MSYTILLCEDEEFIARSYSRKLELEGYKVILAHNGLEALELFHSEHIDLVLLDLMMPLKTGFEVLKEIKSDANEDLRKIPVVIASNLSQHSDIEETKKLGAVDFFVKSNISLKELVLKVKEHLPK
ncbi:MAG: response regulator [Minisyncoccia bacterium]